MDSGWFIKKLSSNCLSNVFQFFDGKEMLVYSTVSTQFYKTHKIDYLWKILASNQSIFVSKRKKESWRDAYVRHVLWISKNMKGGYIDPKTGKSIFTYQMCPIRQHKEIIKQVEIFDNIVISLDEDGIISLSFISYEDPEESKSCKLDEYQGRDVICFNYLATNNTLFVIDSKLNISLYSIEVDEEKESCSVRGTSYSSHVDLFGLGDNMEIEEHNIQGEIKKPRHPIVNFFGNKVIISSDFRERLTESKGNIMIINRENGDILKTITWKFDGIEDAMNIDSDFGAYIDPVQIWDFFGSNIQKNTIWYDYRYDRIQEYNLVLWKTILWSILSKETKKR